MSGASSDLSPVIAASAHWLARAYPPAASDGPAHARAEHQARQAATVAAWLRYPTVIDAALVAIAGPGGSALLDWRAGSEPEDDFAADEGWRTWVDEVVVSWAACLLADPMLARRAVDAVVAAMPVPEGRPRPHARRGGEFRKLISPDDKDREATVLMRHPDLLEPVADMHRDDLYYLLGVEAKVA
ncbi:hypothetical protein [Actinoplanes sp. NPDC089786]|uniref:hypothetical protein n=1 Tax=Actinoplanes sp. NPDC089786 TaxID=3155185 RepID=UPI00343FBB15